MEFRGENPIQEQLAALFRCAITVHLNEGLCLRVTRVISFNAVTSACRSRL